MPAVSVSFAHISRVHQLTLNNKCSRFLCLMEWTPEHVIRECDVELNLFNIKIATN